MPSTRRAFVQTMAASLWLGYGPSLRGDEASTAGARRGFRVMAGRDRADRPVRLGGITPTDTKLSAADADGGMYLFEHRGMRGGGPPEHFHFEQDEWFYAIEGTFGFRVDGEPFTLNAGDMIFLPRRVPHVWAHVGEVPGTILGGVTPAGTLEEFFRKMGTFSSPPPPAEAERIFAAHGMKIVGPPYDAAKSAGGRHG